MFSGGETVKPGAETDGFSDTDALMVRKDKLRVEGLEPDLFFGDLNWG